MPTLELDGLGAWIQANGAPLNFLFASEVADPDAHPVPLAEPREEVGAAVVQPGNYEDVDRGISTRQNTICHENESNGRIAHAARKCHTRYQLAITTRYTNCTHQTGVIFGKVRRCLYK